MAVEIIDGTPEAGPSAAAITDESRHRRGERLEVLNGVAGAPRGNENAVRRGRYCREAIELRRAVATLIREGRELAEKA